MLFSSLPAFAAIRPENATMLLRSTAFVCALTAGAAAYGDELKRVTVHDLAPGSHVEFTNADRVYRAEVTDPTTGEAKLTASSDGVKFSAPRTVFLLGATQGQVAESGGITFVKMNQLQAGLRVELGLGSLEQQDRYLTDPIRSIRVE